MSSSGFMSTALAAETSEWDVICQKSSHHRWSYRSNDLNGLVWRSVADHHLLHVRSPSTITSFCGKIFVDIKTQSMFCVYWLACSRQRQEMSGARGTAGLERGTLWLHGQLLQLTPGCHEQMVLNDHYHSRVGNQLVVALFPWAFFKLLLLLMKSIVYGQKSRVTKVVHDGLVGGLHTQTWIDGLIDT